MEHAADFHPTVILDMSPGHAARFFRAWQQALSSPSAAPPGRLALHYVMLLPAQDAPGFAAALTMAHPQGTPLHAQASELAAHCQSLDVPTQRMLFALGRVSLTLCLTSPDAPLADLCLQADQVFGRTAEPWNRWQCKALARLCRRGAQISLGGAPLRPEAMPVWLEAGFVAPDPRQAASGVACVYAPAWQVKRQTHPAPFAKPGRAAIIGAGLAGASVARALALRGWQVSVLERGRTPASGASGLPAGLVVPHVSADDSPRSRLSRMGVRLMLAQLTDLLPAGQAWAPSGVLEHNVDTPGQDPLWHAQAGWVQVSALVRAWLEHPAIEVHCQSEVASIRKLASASGGVQWSLLDSAGMPAAGVSTPVDLVVITQALSASLRLAGHGSEWQLAPQAREQITACAQVHGTLSWGVHPDATAATRAPFPAQPVNGHGSFIPAVPRNGAWHWMSGSTFEATEDAMRNLAQQHQANYAKLQRLLPDVAQTLHPAFSAAMRDTASVPPLAASEDSVHHWQGSRCVSQDRMPLVGPLEAAPQPGVWISAAMGARGLSFSALCAQLLVAEIHGEPWPVPVSLGRLLQSTRVRRKTRQVVPVD